MGLRLRWLEDGTDRLSWRDLLAVVAESPEGSAVGRWREPWCTQTHLLAGILDALNGANWQRSGKGQAPKPIPRPGQETRTKAAGPGDIDDIPDLNESGVYRGEPTPIDDLADWLGWTSAPTRDEQIVDAYLSGEGSYKKIAERFGVSASTVGRLVRAAR